MKNKIFWLLIALLSLNFGVEAQFKMPKMDTLKTDYYKFEGFGVTQAFLKLPYAGSSIESDGTFKLLEGKTISKVQLVYSDYPKGATLRKLNTQRLQKLYKARPDLFNGDGIEWELVKQTDCSTMEDANQLFHGFVFTYAAPSYLGVGGDRGAEYTKIESLLDGKLKAKDSTILRVFNRNRQWKEMLVVADLTGSMSPYVGELLLWLKLNSKTKPAKSFVFFNDGDSKMDSGKEIGKTGGIYGTDEASLDSVLAVVGMTMANGWGGDLPENNIEAVLYGLEKYPNFKELILIADNNATPRDLELLSRVGVPIKVILCGTKLKAINPNYLTIARKTKGSVHTIEDDLLNLVNVNEGQVITVGDSKFQVRGGSFFRID